MLLIEKALDTVLFGPERHWRYEEAVKASLLSGESKRILSLFDYSGRWSQPYREAGYAVIQVDLGLSQDILDFDYAALPSVHGILAAPPCTDFTVSGAQYWPRKDEDGTTDRALRLVDKVLEIVAYFNPAWWVIENPVGRLPKLRPMLGKPWYWQPYWYGDPYTKKTGLWGDFNPPVPEKFEDWAVEPLRFSKQGSWLQLLGGKSAKTKHLRSLTPVGFARAFFMMNP